MKNKISHTSNPRKFWEGFFILLDTNKVIKHALKSELLNGP